MPYVKFSGEYGAFITGRDVDSALHYEDASDETCVGVVPEARKGEEVIDEAEYERLAGVIKAYNATIPTPAPGVDTDLDAIKATLAKADADVTAAETKTLLLASLRRLHRRGALR